MPIAERNSAIAPKLSDSSTGERRLTSDLSVSCVHRLHVEDRQLAIDGRDRAAHAPGEAVGSRRPS